MVGGADRDGVHECGVGGGVGGSGGKRGRVGCPRRHAS